MMEKYLFIWEGVIFPKYFMLFGQTLWQTLVPWEMLSKKEVLGEMDAVSLRCVPVWGKPCPSFLKNKEVSLSKIVILDKFGHVGQ